MREFDIKEIDWNYYKLLAKNWAALTMKGDDGVVNSMTISWGQYGSLWANESGNNLPVATVFVRPQRFSRPLMDQAGTFSVSFVKPEHKKSLTFLGSKSGRDVKNKVAASGLTVAYYDETPYVAESSFALICRKLYQAPLVAEGFVDQVVKNECYPDEDYHIVYVGQIVAALKE